MVVKHGMGSLPFFEGLGDEKTRCVDNSLYKMII